MSTPLTGGAQAIPQAACLSIPLADSTPMLRRTLCSSSLACYRGSSRDISISYGLRTLWRSEIAQALQALVTSFHFAPGPTCRGSASLYVPPLSYKREDTRRCKADPTQSLKHTSHSVSLRPNSGSVVWKKQLPPPPRDPSKSRRGAQRSAPSC